MLPNNPTPEQDTTPHLHLSWSQTPSGKQTWEVHHNRTCADSCAEKIRNWRPLTVHRGLLYDWEYDRSIRTPTSKLWP